MRPATATLRELLQEINTAIEAQAAIVEDINPLRLEVGGRVNNADIARLDKIIRNEQVLLIRADLDIMRSDNALVCLRVVQPLDMVQVADVERRDVVAEREREVGEFPVGRDVRVDSEVLARAGAEIEEQFGDALLAVCVLAERVDDPDLPGADGGGERGGFGVTGDELDVLDALAVGDRDCGYDLARAEFPQAERVGLLDAVDGRGLEDGDWDDEVGRQDEVVFEVDG